MNLIAGPLSWVFATLYGFIANTAATLTGALLGLAVALFNWVTSENFISLSYTKLDNPFIKTGWELTRDLTNIVFVIALIVIGLGTALRISNYQFQKTLPKLIIIALLINFTPVILGLAVDASNVLMNFFTQGGFAGGNEFANFATRQWSDMIQRFGLVGKDFWNPTQNIAAAAGSTVLIFFNLIAALIYLLYAFLFALRYIAIWVLVILSPICFAFSILPATKFLWDTWLKQFIQWSVFGPVAAFFLYLSDHLMAAALKPGFLTPLGGEIPNAPGRSWVMNGIMPYFISLVLLLIGMFLSLSLAPMGADVVIKAGQRGISRATNLAIRGYSAAIVGGAKGFVKGTKEARGAQRLQELAWAQHFYPGLSLQEARQRWKSQTSLFQRMEVSLKKTGEVLGAGLKGTIPPRPKEGYIKAARLGLGKAVSEVWGVTTGKKPKKKAKKSKQCPTADGGCGKFFDAESNVCPHCGHVFLT